MKYLFWLLLLVSQVAWADRCKVTTVSVEHSGQMDAETTTVCKEGTGEYPKIKIGDVITEKEVGVSRMPKYFNYRNSRCRMFSEHYPKDGKMSVYYGVICQTDNIGQNWLVVDKW
jgi:hypothetical protein